MSSRDFTAADDTALMARVAEGDTRAFEAVYDRYRAPAFGLAVRLTGRSGNAEEVTQDAFLNLWRKAGQYDPSRGTLAAWLLTFVRHRAIDSLRSSARHGASVELETAADRLEAPECTEDRVVARDDWRNARKLVSELPGDQREVIELAYFAGLTQGEIAARVGIPLGTVKGRSRLALDKLRRSLASEPVLAAPG